MKTKCIVCSKEFNDYHNPVRKYCSQACYRLEITGKPRLTTRKREIKKCVVCGNEFETGGRAGKREKFCSRTCQAYARVRQPIVKSMTVTDAAYLAGLMDGEGSIVAAMQRQNRTTWRISIANTDFRLLAWCKEVTGCGSIVRKLSANPKHADGGSWQCYSWNALEIIEQILPYMKIEEKIRRSKMVIKEMNALKKMVNK